jgi:hypothetical protein
LLIDILKIRWKSAKVEDIYMTVLQRAGCALPSPFSASISILIRKCVPLILHSLLQTGFRGLGFKARFVAPDIHRFVSQFYVCALRFFTVSFHGISLQIAWSYV